MVFQRRKQEKSNFFAKIAGFSAIVLLICEFGGTPSYPYDSGTEESTSSSSLCLEIGNEDERRRPSSLNSNECLLEESASPYIQLLSNMLVGSPMAGSCNIQMGCALPNKPFNPKKRRFGRDWPPYGFTMVGTERLKNFRAAVLEVHRKEILGSIMEFGVWRGGAMIMAAAVLRELGASRDLYLFDAFGPVTEDSYGMAHDFLAVDVETVVENFRYFNLYDVEHVHMVKGIFSESIRPWYSRTDPVAVLRMDGNFYDSHQDILYALYENVPVGGIIIFDDIMSIKEVRRCWEDFKSDHGINEDLVQIDRNCAWFRKTKHVSVDQSKKRPPQDIYKVPN